MLNRLNSPLLIPLALTWLVACGEPAPAIVAGTGDVAATDDAPVGIAGDATAEDAAAPQDSTATADVVADAADVGSDVAPAGDATVTADVAPADAQTQDLAADTDTQSDTDPQDAAADEIAGADDVAVADVPQDAGADDVAAAQDVAVDVGPALDTVADVAPPVDVAAKCGTSGDCPAPANVCQSAVCLVDGTCAAIPKSCDDGNSCTTDACNAASGCVHTNVVDTTSCASDLWCKSGTCVAMALPATPTVQISPSTPSAGDSLLCAVVSPVSGVSYDFLWTSPGKPAVASAILPGASATGCATWQCSVTPTIGLVAGTAGTASVVIADTTADICGNSVDDNCNGLTDETCCAIGLTYLDGACLSLDSAAINAGGADSVVGNTISVYLVPPGNALVNGGAEAGTFDPWVQKNTGDGWGIDSTGLFGTHAFRASYGPCVLTQTIELTALGYASSQLDSGPPVRLQLHGLGAGQDTTPWSGGNHDRMTVDVAFLDTTGKQLLSWSSGTINMLVDMWGLANHTVNALPSGTRKIQFAITSQDAEFWGGQYGPLLDGAAVTIGKLDVSLSNDGTTWSAWQAYQPVIANWQTEAGKGSRTVMARFRDATGAVIATVSDSVTVQ